MQLNRTAMFCLSLALHGVVLLALILGYEFSTPLAVIENSPNRDIINAVMLGDRPDSKLILEEKAATPIPEVSTPAVSKIVSKTMQQPVIEKGKTTPEPDAIALKKEEQKRVRQKIIAEKKKREKEMKALLDDIKLQQEKKKKLTQKKLKTHFEKTLREQTEQSLRTQLLNENIQLEAKENRPSQGEINKYKALIIQAISHHWLVPNGADKRLYCELMIKLSPNGQVLEVQLIKSSGDSSLDRSARAAVLKASPLPVPQKPVDFSAFKEFVLKVKPENIASSESLS